MRVLVRELGQREATIHFDDQVLQVPRSWLPKQALTGHHLQIIGNGHGDLGFRLERIAPLQTKPENSGQYVLLLRRLAVLEDPWTIETAQFVTQPAQLGIDFKHALECFEHRRLVQPITAKTDSKRFQLGSGQRQKLLDNALNFENLQPVRFRQLEYYVRQIESFAWQIAYGVVETWLAVEERNLRRVIQWAYQQGKQRPDVAEVGMRLSGNVYLWLLRLGQLERGAQWLEISQNFAQQAKLLPQVTSLLPSAKQVHISQRETDVLQLVARGMTNKEIARTIKLSAHTVKFHLNSLMVKFEANNRTQIVTNAMRHRLI